MQGPCIQRNNRQTAIQARPAKRPMFNRKYELQQLDQVCMKEPGEIHVVLGPSSCGKTATLKSYFSKKKNAVYIDCRTIDASTPKAFTYALIKQLLPKVPRDNVQMALAVLPEMALKLATSLTFVGKLGATTREDVSANLAWLNKYMEKPVENQYDPSMNDLFDALR